MKRDLDPIRLILIELEATTRDILPRKSLAEALSQYDRLTVESHLLLLKDAGFVEYFDRGTMRTVRLTWAGHEFLDNSRDPETWEKAKSAAAKVGSFSIGIFGEVLAGAVKAKLAAAGIPIM